MPKISDYTPETSGAGPAGGVDPNLEILSHAGHGIEDFGRAINEGNDVIQKRIGDMESSDAAASVADLRAKYTQQIDDQTADGTLDVQQIKNQYQDEISGLADNYDSPSGKDAFNRQAGRLYGALTLHAVRGQTLVATKNAMASFDHTINTNANTILNSPSQAHDIEQSTMEMLDNMTQTGTIKAADHDQLVNKIRNMYTTSLVKGATNTNPASGKALLDSGQYDSSLTAQEKQELYGYVNQVQTKNDVAEERALALVRQKQDLEDQKFYTGAVNGMITNSFSPDTLKNSQASGKVKMQVLESYSKILNGSVITDPVAFRDLQSRMFLPDSDPKKITDSSQLYSMVGKQINPEEFKMLSGYLDKTPDGAALNNQRKLILDMAKKQLIGKPVLGETDHAGEMAYYSFVQDLNRKEDQLKSKGEPVSQLYDYRNDKNFVGNTIQNYYPKDKTNFNALVKTGQIPPPQNSWTMPGVQPTPPPSQTQKKVPPAGYDRMVKDGNGKRHWLLKGQGVPQGYEVVQ